MSEEQRPIIYLAGRKRPHELFLLAVSVLIGVSYLAGGPHSKTVVDTIPPWLLIVWAVTMLVSGVVGLAGCFWRGHVESGLRLEEGSMLLGAAGPLLLAGALVVAAGASAIAAALTYAAWAGANIYRAWQIQYDLRGMRKLRRP